MAEIEWDDSYCIGHPEIDAQHRSWFELINRVHRETMLKPDEHNIKCTCKSAIDEMRLYSEMHFRLEEQLMHDLNYFDRQRHMQIHREFVDNLNRIEATIGKDSCTDSHSAVASIFRAMGDWLTTHIMNEDMKIGFSQLAGDASSASMESGASAPEVQGVRGSKD